MAGHDGWHSHGAMARRVESQGKEMETRPKTRMTCQQCRQISVMFI